MTLGPRENAGASPFHQINADFIPRCERDDARRDPEEREDDEDDGLEQIELGEPALLDGNWRSRQRVCERHRFYPGFFDPCPVVADGAAPDLSLRGAAGRRSPAQSPGDVAELVGEIRERGWHVHDASSGPSEPAPVGAHHVLERQGLRSGDLEGEPRRSIRVDEHLDRAHHVLEAHDLKQSGIRHDRQPGQCGEAPEKRACAVGSRAEHDGGAQDDPVEIACHQRFVALKLGARKGRGLGPVDPPLPRSG
jgi:hypothetical protein